MLFYTGTVASKGRLWLLTGKGVGLFRQFEEIANKKPGKITIAGIAPRLNLYGE